jgi:hypothetical protein
MKEYHSVGLTLRRLFSHFLTYVQDLPRTFLSVTHKRRVLQCEQSIEKIRIIHDSKL